MQKSNEWFRERYRQRRDEGLCGTCGKIPSGEKSQCDECAHKTNARTCGYSPSFSERQELFSAQGGKCAICLQLLASLRKAHFDHCHETGETRGLLCLTCNLLLGAAQDSTDILQSAIAYLED